VTLRSRPSYGHCLEAATVVVSDRHDLAIGVDLPAALA
jgi:hypothetical protein